VTEFQEKHLQGPLHRGTWSQTVDDALDHATPGAEGAASLQKKKKTLGKVKSIKVKFMKMFLLAQTYNF
jgi:hypothetical protein